MSLIGRLIDKLLTKGSITLLTPGKAPRTYGQGGGKHLTVRFTDRKVAFDIFRSPSLGVGEAYMDGRAGHRGRDDPRPPRDDLGVQPLGGCRLKPKALGRDLKRLFRKLKRNDPTRSRRNVAHHYDLKDELYELFLDDDKQYSCAYFAGPANSLEQAQADKKAHIAAKLALEPGQRVLDIGCGWGGMALYLHKVAGVDVLGITLSEHQLKIARQRAEAAGVLGAREVRADRLPPCSMSSSTASSRSACSSMSARKHYDEFFAKCRRLLKPDGVMLLHTIGLLGEPASGPDPFTDKYIFPGYHLPSLSEMVSASEKVRLMASDVEMLRLHYAYTLRHWLERAKKERAKIEALYDARFFRMWEFYLAGGIVMFESGAACNYQIQYIRDRNAVPITRDYMFETERRYRELRTQTGAGGKEAARRRTQKNSAQPKLSPGGVRSA